MRYLVHTYNQPLKQKTQINWIILKVTLFPFSQVHKNKIIPKWEYIPHHDSPYIKRVFQLAKLLQTWFSPYIVMASAFN